jgi:hypothetical protein
VVFGAIWYRAEQWRLPARETALAAAGVLAMALVLRRRQTGVWLAMAGFAVLTAGVVTEAVNLHGTRAQYERVMHARERVDSVRHGGAVWFWFNQSDPDSPDYFALNNTYMAEARRLGTTFPEYGCDVKLETGALVVVSSRDERAPEMASGILRDCWRADGMKPVVEEVDRFQPGGRPYTVAMIAAEADSSLRHSLRPVFDSTGKASLEIVENSTAPVAFPPERWVPLQHQTDNPFSALFEGDAYAISWLRASSASFCHYNRRPDRIGSAPPEVSAPDGPSEHAVGAAQHSASAGPTLLRVGEC